MSGELDIRSKEIASVAASIAGNCMPCLKYHLSQAIKIGISKEELKEIIEIAKGIKNRPIEVIHNYANQLLENPNDE
jgi:AhpD family alkylhydroperoxidase